VARENKRKKTPGLLPSLGKKEEEENTLA